MKKRHDIPRIVKVLRERWKYAKRLPWSENDILSWFKDNSGWNTIPSISIKIKGRPLQAWDVPHHFIPKKLGRLIRRGLIISKVSFGRRYYKATRVERFPESYTEQDETRETRGKEAKSRKESRKGNIGLRKRVGTENFSGRRIPQYGNKSGSNKKETREARDYGLD